MVDGIERRAGASIKNLRMNRQKKIGETNDVSTIDEALTDLSVLVKTTRIYLENQEANNEKEREESLWVDVEVARKINRQVLAGCGLARQQGGG